MSKNIIHWKPITTAPMDGTFVLLLGPISHGNSTYRVELGRWSEDFGNMWITLDYQMVKPTHWTEWEPPTFV